MKPTFPRLRYALRQFILFCVISRYPFALDHDYEAGDLSFYYQWALDLLRLYLDCALNFELKYASSPQSQRHLLNQFRLLGHARLMLDEARKQDEPSGSWSTSRAYQLDYQKHCAEILAGFIKEIIMQDRDYVTGLAEGKL